jgi:hypothetical protein
MPNDRDSNGIGKAVVAGRQALRIGLSTGRKRRFPKVNADVGGPIPALVVNFLIQDDFLCAAPIVNNSFHRYDERPVDNSGDSPALAEA